MFFKTIIVSDIHIGMPESQFKRFLAFLEENPCKNLIINWDLVDELYITFFSKRKPIHSSIIKQLKSICKKNKTKIVYLQGNHEITGDIIPELKDLKMQKDMIYLSHNKKYYICHGHQFDQANNKLWILSYIAFFSWNIFWMINRIYRIISKRLWLPQSSLIPSIKYFAKILIWGRKNIDKKLYNKAIEKKCDGIICGHFHETENRKIGKIHYLNSWEWVETWSAILENQKGDRDIYTF